jgi:O-antigen/teichoic acid export membrane protein
MMLPVTAGWLQQQTPRQVAWRLLPVVLGVATAAGAYLGSMWLLRDWIFARVLNKDFAQRDILLLLWSAVSLLMVVRDQSVHLLVSSGRLRQLTLITACSAAISLCISWWGMHRYGVTGALLGVLCGEALNLLGIFAATAWCVLRPAPSAALQPAPQAASSA